MHVSKKCTLNPKVYFESHFVPSSELTFAVFLSQLSEGVVVLINDIMTLLNLLPFSPTFLKYLKFLTHP